MNKINITKLGFYRPICFYKNNILCYKKGCLYFYNGIKFAYHCKIKISGFRGFVSKTRLLTRIMHRYVYCGIAPTNSPFAYISANDGIYRVSLDKKDFIEKIFTFKPGDMHRPLSMFEVFSINGFDNAIIFGDYSYNKNRDEMCVYAIKENDKKIDVVYTFPKGTIRHIHSIIPDPFRDRVLILTGDKDEECCVLEAKDNFKNVRLLFSGKQEYRFCAGKAFSNYVALVTDSPFNQNYVFALKKDGPSNRLESLFNVPGPTVFFTLSHENELIFATDVENDEKGLSPLQEFFINKKGDGVLDNYSHVFSFSPERGLKEIIRFEKDKWPMRIFGFGTVHFPSGGNDDNILYLFPMSVKKYDQQLVRIDRNESN